MASTSKPNGISITRDGGLKFVVSWKVTDRDYAAGQQMRYRVVKQTGKAQDWTTVSVASNFTTKSFTLTASNWAPSVGQLIDRIEVQVRGKRSPSQETIKGKTVTTTYDWSAWAQQSWTLQEPKRPEVETELTAANRTDFSWEVETSDSDGKPFVSTQWQSILKRASKETNGAKLTWGSSNPYFDSGTGSDTGTKYFSEGSGTASDSYTRWFRIRSRGPAGNSEWKYSKHVYAKPYKPVITSAKATEGTITTTLVVKWTAQSTAAHPIDDITVQWLIDTPAAGLACPTGASWQDGATLADTSGTDAAKFVIDEQVEPDTCLWVRVVANHDISQNPSNFTESEPVLVKKGTLSAPEISNVQTNASTHQANITAVNNSDVPDANIAVIFRMAGVNTIVAVIPAGQTSVSAVQCPDWGDNAFVFGLKTFQGSYTAKTGLDGVTVYTLQKNMSSANVWQSGNVPTEPTGVTADASLDSTGEVIVRWNWSWQSANQAELSWSTNPNAWESTDQPQTFVVDSINSAQWRISGLETGQTWYFAVRLMITNGDNVTYGPYSDPVAVDLSTTPNIPILALDKAIVPVSGELTATWDYSSTDGTDQAVAEICECTISNGIVTYGTIIAHAETARHVTIGAENWTAGETYYLAVRVTSGSGKISEWSDPVPVLVAEQLVLIISDTSLTSVNVSDGDGGTYTTAALTTMPLTATIEGAGEGGTTTLIIERNDEYHVLRPDETTRDGYAGETIALFRQTGEAQISIGQKDLIGILDDGAKYRLIAMIEDGFGQADTDEIEFEVHWIHQAGVPTATVTTEDNVAVITPTAPSTYASGDTCDIYRLSADKPQLIYSGATFGTAYVDPFPTLGEHAGYRCVCITANGDYITADNQLAWVDVKDTLFDNKTGVIDFDGRRLEVKFNTALSSSWKKDFKETKYLGGTVRGDWNPAISRTGSVTAVLTTDDTDSIQTLRRLADYSGICHVRTQDGSSFAADVQVSDGQTYGNGGNIEEFTLNITRVEPEALDGIPYSEWKVS